MIIVVFIFDGKLRDFFLVIFLDHLFSIVAEGALGEPIIEVQEKILRPLYFLIQAVIFDPCPICISSSYVLLWIVV